MSYQVIARKWRPQTFEEVTGQEAITQTLRNALENDRLHHAYLFSGARGVGKTTTARLLAKALNCHKTAAEPNPFPCSFNDPAACVSCREISESRSIDVLEFDAASHTGVDDIREIILESINIAPARDRYKVFIIDEVHMLSNSSFNALLKTLEEPPPRVVFIMATTELHKVPDTILSRCQEFEFRTIAVNKIFERLKLIAEAENVTVSDDALKEIARSGEGSMRDAQSNFDQVISFSGEKITTADVTSALGLASAEMLTRIAAAIAGSDPKEVLKVVDELISRGQDLRNFARDLLSFFRDLLVFKMAGDAENLLDTAVLSLEEMRTHAAPFSESDLIRFFNSLSDTEGKLKEATQTRYVLEIGLIKLVEMRRVTPLEKILERLARLEAALADGNLPAPAADAKPAAPPIGAAEKKTLNSDAGARKYDFAPEEVPFAVSEKRAAAFAPAQSDAAKPSSEPAQPAQPATVVSFTPRTAAAHKSPPAAENFVPPATAEPEMPDFVPVDEIQYSPFDPNETASSNAFNPVVFDAGSPINDEFLSSITIKLPSISSEDLEHIEDTKLDDAFEEKLARLGDNLYPIANAEQIVQSIVGSSPAAETAEVAEISAGSASRKTSFVIPNFDDDDDEPTELPVLSENPTREELFAYAGAHPSVKKIMRVFRAKIVSVERDAKENSDGSQS